MPFNIVLKIYSTYIRAWLAIIIAKRIACSKKAVGEGTSLFLNEAENKNANLQAFQCELCHKSGTVLIVKFSSLRRSSQSRRDIDLWTSQGAITFQQDPTYFYRLRLQQCRMPRRHNDGRCRLERSTYVMFFPLVNESAFMKTHLPIGIILQKWYHWV